MYKLELEHHFSAAHQLKNAFSKECNDFLHGHNWKVKVEIEAHYLVEGMIIDFKKLKSIINELDHKNLMTDVPEIDFETTAENLVEYLQAKIKKEMIERYKSENSKITWLETYPPFKVSVTLWEADNASIKYYE